MTSYSESTESKDYEAFISKLRSEGNLSRGLIVDGRVWIKYGGFWDALPMYRQMEGDWVYIYALADPIDGIVRYIGKSIRPNERLTNHCNEKPTCHRTKWIQKMIREGRRPIISIFGKLDPKEDWQDVEKGWIAFAKKYDWNIVNGTDGGDGVCGLNPESRERVRMAWVGRKHSDETKRKLSLVRRGRKHGQAFRDKMKIRMKDRYFSPSHRNSLSQAIRKFTDDDIASILARISDGAKVKDIAKEFGVHRVTISKMKTGKPKGKNQESFVFE